MKAKALYLLLSGWILPIAASAQTNTNPNDTTSPDRSVDTYHPADKGIGDQAIDKTQSKYNESKFREDVRELKRDIEVAAASANAEGQTQLDSLRRRAEALEDRASKFSSEAGDKWKASKQRLKSELSQLRDEFRETRRRIGGEKPQQQPTQRETPTYP